jgi:hypothetical protein
VTGPMVPPVGVMVWLVMTSEKPPGGAAPAGWAGPYSLAAEAACTEPPTKAALITAIKVSSIA